MMLRQHCQGGFGIPSRSGHDIKGLSRSRPDVPCRMSDYLRAELPDVQPQAVGTRTCTDQAVPLVSVPHAG